MTDRTKNYLKHLTIPGFSKIDSEEIHEAKLQFSISFSQDNPEIFKDSKLSENNLQLPNRIILDDLTTPTFKTQPTFEKEGYYEIDEYYEGNTDEWVSENDHAKKVKVLLCSNTNKINIFYQRNEIPGHLEYMSLSQDSSWQKKTCSNKSMVCGCLII